MSELRVVLQLLAVEQLLCLSPDWESPGSTLKGIRKGTVTSGHGQSSQLKCQVGSHPLRGFSIALRDILNQDQTCRQIFHGGV